VVSAEAAAVLGLLAEDDRLRAVAALVLGARTAGEVAEATGLTLREAGRALSRLETGGLVETDGHEWRLLPERFKEALATLDRSGPSEPAPASALGPEGDRVLRSFVRDGRLSSIPAHHGKRRVVLDWLAGNFEPGHAYPEREVNAILGRFHPDVAALRRYLVDDEFLHRRDGFYWRAGGTFHVDLDAED
jgi:hypothetical protein